MDKFDGLAADYDRYRPRYPIVLLATVAANLAPQAAPLVLDTGAGTGVALEGLLPILPAHACVEAIDASADMVALGRAKFPEVRWHVGAAEPFLERSSDVSLIIAAQSYQWMERRRYLRAAGAALAPGGCLAIVQNNRDFVASTFLEAYETLLESWSPGYSRDYRAFDIASEVREAFGAIEVERSRWTKTMAPEEFLGMVRSSTQVQRALAAHGSAFTRTLENLIAEHLTGGQLLIPYASEAFMALKPAQEPAAMSARHSRHTSRGPQQAQ